MESGGTASRVPSFVTRYTVSRFTLLHLVFRTKTICLLDKICLNQIAELDKYLASVVQAVDCIKQSLIVQPVDCST
jgi:hypothetical protein